MKDLRKLSVKGGGALEQQNHPASRKHHIPLQQRVPSTSYLCHDRHMENLGGRTAWLADHIPIRHGTVLRQCLEGPMHRVLICEMVWEREDEYGNTWASLKHVQLSDQSTINRYLINTGTIKSIEILIQPRLNLKAATPSPQFLPFTRQLHDLLLRSTRVLGCRFLFDVFGVLGTLAPGTPNASSAILPWILCSHSPPA